LVKPDDPNAKEEAVAVEANVDAQAENEAEKVQDGADK
jgi:hypothetical protein